MLFSHKPRLTDDRPDRLDVLDAVQAAGLKVIRIFISYTDADNKRSGSVLMPDIEPEEVGKFDDTQLEAIDQLMVDAHARGMVSFKPLCMATDIVHRHQADNRHP